MRTRGGQVQNLWGSRISQANVCPVKKETRQSVEGWRSPSPRRRGRRASAPLEGETAEGPVTEEGGEEVEVQPEASGVEGMEE